MTYVVTETCIKCKYTDCVDVCPVDCFREGPNFLVIDPDECIDCTLCVAECPVEAIFAEDDVPDDQKEYTALNAELAKIWKPIIEKKDGPPDADEWAKVKEKKHLLEKRENWARVITPASRPRSGVASRRKRREPCSTLHAPTLPNGLKSKRRNICWRNEKTVRELSPPR